MGNFISWTSEDGLNNRDDTFMPEFGKDVSYSEPGGTSFGGNLMAFSNSVVSQALNQAQKAEVEKEKAARQADEEFDRISNPDTYEPTDAPESFHLGEIVGKDTIDEKWDPEKWKGLNKHSQLSKEIETYMEDFGTDATKYSKEDAYEFGKMLQAAANFYEKHSKLNKVLNILNKVINKARGVDVGNIADSYSAQAKNILDIAYAKDKADEEAAKEKVNETLGSSAPASSRFTADMKGESKVDTTPSKTFEDVRNEFKDESKKETKPELNRDPLPNVGPRDYTDKPELKNDIASVNIADIKKAAEQTGTDIEKVKAIAKSPKFIQTIESKLGDLLLKMGRRAARYNPLTLAVALYESVKNGEGMEKSIDKAIDALGLERDSMTQDEYDALYKEIEGIRSSIDRGDFKISIADVGPAAATSDATPTDFFDGLLNTDKTDYSGYNAGLTASDKDTKEIIVRVYKKDPVLRLLKC